MKARGYSISDFDQRSADISVDHPRVVENVGKVEKKVGQIEKVFEK